MPCPQRNVHLSAYSHSNNKLTFICLPQKHLESYLADCYDAIAVFLCIHIVLRFRNIAAKRDVPALDRSLSSGPWCLDVVSFLCYENSSILTLGPHLMPFTLIPIHVSQGQHWHQAHPLTVTLKRAVLPWADCTPSQLTFDSD